MRLPYMISFYNMLLAYTCYFAAVKPTSLPSQVVAANAMFIAFGVVLYYAYHGFQSPKLFYDDLFFPMPIPVWYVVDFFVHFAPLVLLGLARSPIAYGLSVATILSWYTWIRTKTTYIYGVKTHVMDTIVYKYGIVLAIMIIFASTWFR